MSVLRVGVCMWCLCVRIECMRDCGVKTKQHNIPLHLTPQTLYSIDVVRVSFVVELSYYFLPLLLLLLLLWL